MSVFGKFISISASKVMIKIINEFVRIVLLDMATIFWLAEEALDALGSSVQWKISPKLRTQMSFGETLALLGSAQDDARSPSACSVVVRSPVQSDLVYQPEWFA